MRKNKEFFLVELAKNEYEKITNANIHVQLDCPDLALARHMNFKDLSEEDFLKKAEILDFGCGKANLLKRL